MWTACALNAVAAVYSVDVQIPKGRDSLRLYNKPFHFHPCNKKRKKREITTPLVQRSAMYIRVYTRGKNVGTLGEERAAATGTWSVVKYICSQLAISKREGMMLPWWIHLRASLCCILYCGSHWLVRKTIQIMIIIAFMSDRKKIRTWDKISRKSGVYNMMMVFFHNFLVYCVICY